MMPAFFTQTQPLKNLRWPPAVLMLDKRRLPAPLDTHKWTLYDLQYLFLAALFVMIFCVVEVPSTIPKLLVAVAFAVGLYLPKPRKFMLPFLPVAGWLLLFYACRFVPSERRPHIYVSVLPALENILYGDNLSAIIAKHTNVVKDVLAWLPYGVVHFSLPFAVSATLWYYGPPGILPVFARGFGYMNIVGVLTQLAFPCSPPWYETVYGMDIPASYSMPGDPGGLRRIDLLFGSSTYTTAFTGSPMVFGAFPSLHSACAIIQTLFLGYVLPRTRPFGLAYVFWIWWSCMYLTHHYMVDLVGGGVYAIITFWMCWQFIPTVREDCATRWDYNYTPDELPMYRVIVPAEHELAAVGATAKAAMSAMPATHNHDEDDAEVVFSVEELDLADGPVATEHQRHDDRSASSSSGTAAKTTA